MSWYNAFRRLERKKVVVNLDTGQAFEGILYRQSGPLLMIRNATLYGQAGARTAVDGEVVVERRSVQFIQITG